MKLVYVSPVTKVMLSNPTSFYCASRYIDDEETGGPGGGTTPNPIGDDGDDEGGEGSLSKRGVWDSW